MHMLCSIILLPCADCFASSREHLVPLSRQCAGPECLADQEGLVLLQHDFHVAKGLPFEPVQGNGGNLPAYIGTDVCNEDSYNPSDLEHSFFQNANLWTNDPATLCSHLQEWVTENLIGRERGSATEKSGMETGSSKFSRLC